jgi:hypothetical protein
LRKNTFGNKNFSARAAVRGLPRKRATAAGPKENPQDGPLWVFFRDKMRSPPAEAVAL